MAFLYGLLYLFMTAYPIVFQQIHGFNKGVGGLTYFGMIIGEFLGGFFIIFLQPWYNKKLDSNNGIPIPEWRLPPAILGGVAFSGGLFWFGWSGYKADFHWAVPAVSGLLTGFGLLCIFLQCMNYIVDAYLVLYVLGPSSTKSGKETNANSDSSAASALATNSILRSTAGAGFPLFATYMVRNSLPEPQSERMLTSNVVQRTRSQLDRNSSRLRRGCFNANPSLILPLRPQDSSEEQILHGLCYDCSSSQ